MENKNILPTLLDRRLQLILGDRYDDVISAFSSERIGSFRINTLKATPEEVLNELSTRGVKYTPYSIDGVYTFERESEYALKGSDAFYQGKIYLQGISSMLPVLALDLRSGDQILDVCAAPGSKTTQIAMILGNDCHITALEQNQIRFDKLVYNARLQGATSVEAKKQDALKFFTSSNDTYHKILLDVPCSAEGRINLSNEKTYGFWSLENIEKKASMQYELPALAFAKLRVGGMLVYSTCTLAPEENEGIISRLLSDHPDATLEPIDIGLGDKAWWQEGIVSFDENNYNEEVKKAVRIFPSRETEGFFIAKILKR